MAAIAEGILQIQVEWIQTYLTVISGRWCQAQEERRTAADYLLSTRTPRDGEINRIIWISPLRFSRILMVVIVTEEGTCEVDLEGEIQDFTYYGRGGAQVLSLPHEDSLLGEPKHRNSSLPNPSRFRPINLCSLLALFPLKGSFDDKLTTQADTKLHSALAAMSAANLSDNKQRSSSDLHEKVLEHCSQVFPFPRGHVIPARGSPQKIGSAIVAKKLGNSVEMPRHPNHCLFRTNFYYDSCDARELIKLTIYGNR